MSEPGSEILTFLRLRKRRLALVLLVPLIAGALALVSSLGVRDRHEAQVELEILAPESDTPNAALQAATRLSRLASSDDVVEAAAESSGQPVAIVRRGIATNQDATKVTVLYDATLPAEAVEEVVLADAEISVAALFAPAVDEAARAVEDADSLDLAAREAVSEFEVAHGLSADPEQYRAVLQPEQIVEYERLLAAVVRSGNALDRAERDRDQLESRLNTTMAQVPSFAGGAERVSKVTLIGRRVAMAVAAGLVLAVALLLLAEVLWPPRRRPVQAEGTSPDQAVETLRRLTARLSDEDDREAPAREAVGGR